MTSSPPRAVFNETKTRIVAEHPFDFLNPDAVFDRDVNSDIEPNDFFNSHLCLILPQFKRTVTQIEHPQFAMTPAEEYAQKRIEAVALIETHAPPRLHQSLIDLLRPAIALNVARCDDDSIPIGASKFGGAPDVAAGFEWPLNRALIDYEL